MCVDISHLVLEALGDTDDQVVDEGSDGSEGCDVLPGTVVQLDVDDILLGVGEVDSQVVQVLREFAYSPPSELRSSSTSSNFLQMTRTSWTLDRNQSRLDADLDYSRDGR